MERIAHNASDLSGQRFGMLVALERCGNKNGKIALWKCMCDCGNECIVYASSLKRGLTKSCGCYRNTFLKKRNEAIDKTHYGAVCSFVVGGCGASTGWYYETPEEAAKAWNTRQKQRIKHDRHGV